MNELRNALVLAAVSLFTACGDTPAPTADSSKAAASGSAKPVASTPAPTATATATATTTATASAAPAPSASASATSSAALIPAEAPAPTPPGPEEFAAETKEIAVKQSSVQKCTTKVLKGWFEMSCPEAEGLVRATKIDLLTGFDAKQVVEETGEGKTLRWVAALPASGEKCQARFWGKGLHEIFLTLEHTDKGWKGELSGKKP
ncbi:MAG: hypothetical protein JNK04_17790 [Myxococcales bacterium]|nr:hypothetical protein [Myxococcales bacterium]